MSASLDCESLRILKEKKNACDLFTTVNMYPTEEALKNIYEMTFETNKSITFNIIHNFFPIMLAGKKELSSPIVELWPRLLLRRDQIGAVAELEGLESQVSSH